MPDDPAATPSELPSLRSPDEAIAAFLARIAPVGTEHLPLSEATGRILAQDLRTDRPSPATDVSAMDGFVARLAQLRPGRSPIAGEVRIGHAPPTLPETGVLRIVTGAPIPPGADVVFKREDVREAADSIEISADAIARTPAGSNIRRQGENAAQGVVILDKGRRITPAVAGALSTFGLGRPSVYKRVRVAILTTGDEVLEPDATPQPWQLRNSNGPALRALLSQPAWLDVHEQAHAPDDPEAIREFLIRLTAESDAVFITGGVSMGDRDFIPKVLQQLGAETLFHRLPQRPGRPMLGAVTERGAIFGLPGNPVSVLVTARRIACPVLQAMSGVAPAPAADAMLTLENPSEKRLDLWWHRPAFRTGPASARVLETMGSGDVPAVAASDGFIELPPGESGPGPWPFFAWSVA